MCIRDRNNTEGKRAQALEQRYRRLFESAQDGILIRDSETGLVVDANPFITQLLGYSLDDVREKYICDLGFFRNIAANKDKFLELQQHDYVRYDDLPLETAQGMKIHVEFVSNVYLVDHARVIQCNIRDISERKAAEEKIQNLSMAVEQSTENIIITDLNARIEYANAVSYTHLHGGGAGGQTQRAVRHPANRVGWRSRHDHIGPDRDSPQAPWDGLDQQLAGTTDRLVGAGARPLPALAVR